MWRSIRAWPVHYDGLPECGRGWIYGIRGISTAILWAYGFSCLMLAVFFLFRPSCISPGAPDRRFNVSRSQHTLSRYESSCVESKRKGRLNWKKGEIQSFFLRDASMDLASWPNSSRLNKYARREIAKTASKVQTETAQERIGEQRAGSRWE